MSTEVLNAEMNCFPSLLICPGEAKHGRRGRGGESGANVQISVDNRLMLTVSIAVRQKCRHLSIIDWCCVRPPGRGDCYASVIRLPVFCYLTKVFVSLASVTARCSVGASLPDVFSDLVHPAYMIWFSLSDC